MQLLLFAKHLRALSMPELVRAATQMGIDGYDWPVRAGYAVNPDNVGVALREFAGALRGEGLRLGMCTGEGGLTDPSDPCASRILDAMAENGVPFLKIGYFPCKAGQDYRAVMDAARRHMAGWQELARPRGVTVCYHTHSGWYLGCTAASLAELLRDLDPRHVGAYLDAGHLAVAGEPFPMACSIAGGSLRLVGVKDMKRQWVEESAGRVLRCIPAPIGQGFLDTPKVFGHMAAMPFTGPVVLHVEFECARENLIADSRREALACRAAWEGARAAASGAAKG